MASSSKEVTQCFENNFRPLVADTDINIAPDNWLTGSQEEVISEACQWDISDPPELSSISMAARLSNKFMDADVISDTRNIKKLLRIHHSDGEVSMAVHRIRKTLLIDEFPIDRHIPQQAEKPTRRKRRRNKNASTISKFLYHTILNNNYLTSTVSSVVTRKNSFSDSDIIVGMGDPLSKIVVELPQIENTSYRNKDYNRTVYWDFEDIQMLLGNNMPIFGGGEYPAISLKLRDMTEPINVLTGIDCWLDNLICNVPELAMCWHIDGIIQSYDLYKTEDIPNIKGSKFSPLVIKDLANNVLRFLKKNCIKEGHTYWLFKAKGDDIVKLYDLSSLCTGINLNEINPFSTPVAMLCFKVAQKLFEDQRPEERNTMYTLLKNCLDLITTNTYPQIEATCHFMISDLFLSNSFGVVKDKNIELKFEPLFECSYSSVPDMCSCSRSDLLDPEWEPAVSDCYWVPLATNIQQHKEKALEHIVAALQVVSHQTDCWAVKLQKLLLFKASQIFLHKSQTLKGSGVFSNALLSLITIDAYNALLYFKETEYKHGYGYDILRSLILCHVADCVLGELLNPNPPQTSTAISTIHNLLLSLSSLEFDKNSTKIFEWCNLIVPDLSFSKRVTNTKFETKEIGLLLCLDMYLDAARYKEDIVMRKLGFVYNELGSYNLNLINLVCEERREEDERKREEEIAKKLLKQSFQHFKKAISSFLKCNDVQNIALIYSNLGKVMRTSAQLQAKYYYGGAETRGPLLYEEKTFYEEAINYYNLGLDTLRKPSVQKDIWCTISNELSSVYFSMATILQDFTTVENVEEKSEMVREVTNLLNKALRISEGLVREGFLQARRRTGGIHHKLASLYHNEARDGDSTKKLKRVYSLAEVNYEKAMSYFNDKDFSMEYIQAVMEYVGLLQHLSTKPSNSLSQAINLLCELSQFIAPGNTDIASFNRILLLLKKQLLSLLKHTLTLHKNGTVFEGILSNPKECYLIALKGLQGFEDSEDKGRIMVMLLEELDGLK